MTDYYICLRNVLAEYCSSVLCADILPAFFFLAPHGYAARCDAPLRMKPQQDGSSWASALNRQADYPHLFGAPLIGGIIYDRGHILFRFTEKFYTAATAHILLEAPKAVPMQPNVNNHHIDAGDTRERTLLETAAYTQRRMWMLAREATRIDLLCPEAESVQRALLLCMGLTEKGIGRRAAFWRLEMACDALLSMSHAVAPRERPQFLLRCAHVGDAASRLLVLFYKQWQEV